MTIGRRALIAAGAAFAVAPGPCSEALERLGFEVDTQLDLTHTGLQDALREFGYQAESAEVELRTVLAGGTVLADERRMEQVLANLIDNTRIHGGDEPIVSVTEPDGEGEPLGHIWIAVEDRGPGVPPEERGRIFERFSRV